MTYFTADLHLGHRKLQEAIRNQFTSVEDMNEGFFETLNRMVRPKKDRLYILGDFGANPSKSSYFADVHALRSRINCRDVRLVFGNHDDPEIGPLFAESGHILYFKENHIKYSLCHFPLIFWEKSHRGHCHLHGHDHGDNIEALETAMPGARRLDVGIDVAFKMFEEYRPFTLDEVRRHMADRPGFLLKSDNIAQYLKQGGTQ